MADQIAEEVDATQKIVRRRSFHQFLDESREWRRWFAEGWGTFLLVAVAVGSSIMASTSGSVSPAAAAVAPGLMVMAIIYFMGTVSGAHLNPAVTVAFSLRGNFPWHRAFGYIVAQFDRRYISSPVSSGHVWAGSHLGHNASRSWRGSHTGPGDGNISDRSPGQHHPRDIFGSSEHWDQRGDSDWRIYCSCRTLGCAS